MFWHEFPVEHCGAATVSSSSEELSVCCRDATEGEIPKSPQCPLSEELWENLCRLQCRKMCVSLDQQLYFYLMQNDHFITNYTSHLSLSGRGLRTTFMATFNSFAEMYTFTSEFLVSGFFIMYKPHFLYYLIF